MRLGHEDCNDRANVVQAARLQINSFIGPRQSKFETGEPPVLRSMSENSC